MKYTGNQACCCNNSLALSVVFVGILRYLLAFFGEIVVFGGINIGVFISILILS